MIPSRIQKVLSTLANRQVQALLMGGQACVFYGAAEFSRDADLVVLAQVGKLQRLRRPVVARECWKRNKMPQAASVELAVCPNTSPAP